MLKAMRVRRGKERVEGGESGDIRRGRDSAMRGRKRRRRRKKSMRCGGGMRERRLQRLQGHEGGKGGTLTG